MKKIAFILGVALLVGMSSCSKEKDCTCTTTSSIPTVPATTVDKHIDDGDCSDLDTKATTAGITTKVTCKEK